MPLSRRYTPEHSPADSLVYGMSFEYLLPPGVGIEAAALDVYTNAANPVEASADFDVVGPAAVEGRVVYAPLAGGRRGQDYQLRWTVADSAGNVWQRTALLLVALTS